MKQIKVFLTLSILLVASISASAQLGRPNSQQPAAATWTSKVEMKGSKKGDLVITMKVADKWHVYGTEVAEGGPRAMVFDFASSTGVKFTGEPTPSVEPKREIDATFGVEVTYYGEGTVVFRVPFKVIGQGSHRIKGVVSWQACNDETCTMPQRTNIDLPVNVR